jgi:hypothetical protein
VLGRLLSGCVSHVKLLVAAAQGSSKRRAVGLRGPAVVSSKLSSKYGMPVPCTHGLKYGMQLPRNAAILHSVQLFKNRVTMQKTHCAANCLPFNVGSSKQTPIPYATGLLCGSHAFNCSLLVPGCDYARLKQAALS